MAFVLDPRLEGDTFEIGKLELCQVRLMDDARWPWLILVPGRSGLQEMHDLEAGDQMLAAAETARASAALKAATSCLKINTGALGNVVRQLHIHVIARNEGDTNWPGAVWGYGSRESYSATARETLVKSISERLFG